jgi:hypothetical protein
MEKKKLKKLVLKKDIVSKLDNAKMNQMRGGGYPTGLPTCDYATCGETVGVSLIKVCPTTPPICCEYGCCETVGC